jgi:ubiquinol-cytochrome c reductase iron-sulfur subunit
VEVSLADVAPGEMLEVEWQGRLVFVRHRTQNEITRERAVPLESLRDPERDQARARRSEWVVVEGICTHGGCVPDGPLGDFGGWYCLCHGSQFDTAGRVRAGPARQNLKIPPYEFVGERTLKVGER